jgi:tetratricopeptide (TPR) repeat protein
VRRIEKTVFISYRRTNVPWALAIYQHLSQHDFDVFFDYQSIASGDFEQVILESIKARAHFIVLLTPSALERCDYTGDWLRREIETALATQRNIVPLMLEGFDFATPAVDQYLTGKLTALKSYNALRVPAEYFDEAMVRLRGKYLHVPLDAVLHPLSLSVQQAVKTQQAAADIAPVVTEKVLTAHEWFENGYKATDPDEQIHCYTEAIRLKPDYALAYYNRGLARYDKGDLDAALEDYTEAIRLKPDYAHAYYNRGLARRAKGDLDGGLKDYTKAIRLKPDYALAYYNRGNARRDKGDLDAALEDYTEAIRLKPDYARAYYNRAVVWKQKADRRAAIGDFKKYLGLGGAVRSGDQAAVEKIIRDLQ